MEKIFIQICRNGQITLPAIVRKLANLQEGDRLELTVEEDGAMRLVKTPQSYFWHERWQTGEQMAQNDIENGRTIRFENVDDALIFLESND